MWNCLLPPIWHVAAGSRPTWSECIELHGEDRHPTAIRSCRTLKESRVGELLGWLLGYIFNVSFHERILGIMGKYYIRLYIVSLKIGIRFSYFKYFTCFFFFRRDGACMSGRVECEEEGERLSSRPHAEQGAPCGA